MGQTADVGTERWGDPYRDLVSEALARSNRPQSVDHGIHHWQLVAVCGAELIPLVPGVDPDVVFCFALFHDSMRENDYVDPGHGKRGGELARELLGGRELLDEAQLDDLVYACDHHTSSRTSDDPTIGVCWDSDRLNLWRVAIEPDPRLMSTSAGRDPERIAWAERLQDENHSWDEIREMYGGL
ncbi:MAG: uncharacterized protein QOG16_204 [Actinomycetota bacterium]|nr:uncharacterized protein [Actinomycetota bacterium]